MIKNVVHWKFSVKDTAPVISLGLVFCFQLLSFSLNFNHGCWLAGCWLQRHWPLAIFQWELTEQVSILGCSTLLWWWWQWKRWQSTKQGTLAKQMPEWATDKQIVPPHTMIEEHCLQNAEDDTGRHVFCHLVHRMWTILSACCRYQYWRPPNPSTPHKIASQNCWLYLHIPFKKIIFLQYLEPGYSPSCHRCCG